MISEPCYYRVSVKGIVIADDGSILLAKQDDEAWDMLGGGIEFGEDPVTCLKREVMEEEGLAVSYISPAPIHFFTVERQSAPGSYAALVVYEIKLASMKIRQSPECQALEFFSPKAAGKLHALPGVIRLAALRTQLKD